MSLNAMDIQVPIEKMSLEQENIHRSGDMKPLRV